MRELIEQVLNIQKRCNRIFIYGTGLYGQNIYNICKENNINIEGFLVTKNEEKKQFNQMCIYTFEHVKKEKIGIILGLNQHNSNEVQKYLTSEHFDMSMVIDAGKMIEKGAPRGGLNNKPAIEFTMTIGCSVSCKYCPQEILLKKYFSTNINRTREMQIESFKLYLSKLPKDCAVIFGGMSEPFLNKHCYEMMKIACDTARHVELHTTLVGMNSERLKSVLELPLNFVVLHVADKNGYAKIPTSNEYYKMIEMIISQKKRDGSEFVNYCNSQAKPDQKVVQIIGEKSNILTSLLDRAGNLGEDSGLLRKSLTEGKIKCSQCSERLNRNVLLPDGTLLLCCMDYGMKHQLGNLSENSYEEIMEHGKEIMFVKEGMNGQLNHDILCRSCSCASLQ